MKLTEGVWLDIHSIDDKTSAQLQKLGIQAHTLEQLRQNLHHLGLTKHEPYVLLTIVATLIKEEETQPIYTKSALLHILFDQKFIVTLHEHSLQTIDDTKNWSQTNPAKPEDVLFRLLRRILLQYLQDANELVVTLEKINGQFLRHPYSELYHPFLAVRRRNSHLRQALSPAMQAFYELKDPKLQFVSEQLRPFFRDLYDLGQLITQRISNVDDSISSLIQSFASVQSNEMNKTIKVLTIISTFAIPAEVIAGVYGMNFYIPEIHWPFGYAYALVLILITSFGLYILLK